MPEARTVRPRVTGSIRADLGDRPYGLGRLTIEVDPKAHRDNGQIRIKIDDTFGPQITDHREHSLHCSLRAAKELRDALTLALEWDEEKEETP